jgi:5-methylcytosine-specific restriction endonuclease McrBC GTP-binding regulatory subunit McrB
VTLPYSKQEFSVPSNLYILGTMNTADRSVEALDSALRRRFSFIEMMPEYDLPELDKQIMGIQLSRLLKTINLRIEKLLDRDHQIGHSYLLRVNTEADLQRAFIDKIIPLLQEYFYGDYEKLGLVLGEGFVESVTGDDQIFAKFSAEDLDIYDRPSYELKQDALNKISEFKLAINRLMNISTPESEE